MPAPTAMRDLADLYRRQRVVFDSARRAYDSNENGEMDDALEEALDVAAGCCQRTANDAKMMTVTKWDDHLERASVLLDAALMADVAPADLQTILSELEAAEPRA